MLKPERQVAVATQTSPVEVSTTTMDHVACAAEARSTLAAKVLRCPQAQSPIEPKIFIALVYLPDGSSHRPDP